MKYGNYIDEHGTRTTPQEFKEEDAKLTEAINFSCKISLYEKEIKNHEKEIKNNKIAAIIANWHFFWRLNSSDYSFGSEL
jgi:hypothetical protein